MGNLPQECCRKTSFPEKYVAIPNPEVRKDQAKTIKKLVINTAEEEEDDWIMPNARRLMKY